MSFLESEVLRKTKREVNLSEMFVVNHTYRRKALNYVRHHGSANFSEGGQAHDVQAVMAAIGLVPEEAYPGIIPGYTVHNHGELEGVLKGMLDAVVGRKGGHLSSAWERAFGAVLNQYLGDLPEQFAVEGKTYTPQTYTREYLKLDPADYVEITSYSHHPYYTTFALEIPDNWDYSATYHNVPMEDMERIADEALRGGYTFCWDADVSEPFFSKDRMDVSLVPEKNWEEMSRAERTAPVEKPLREAVVTQEMRQKTFMDYSTTDDHLMHIVGLAKDQRGESFYIMKNSWGKENKYQGFYYVSKPYFRLKTVALMVHKDAIPQDIRARMGL